MAYVTARSCVDAKDRVCVGKCPVDYIYEDARLLYVHPEERVNYGAYELICPTKAIFYEDNLPFRRSDYLRTNVDFFSDLGGPGGAWKTGVQGFDDPMIAALPPQNEGWKVENL